MIAIFYFSKVIRTNSGVLNSLEGTLAVPIPEVVITCCQTRYVSHLFLSWMFIGFSSVSFRFLYVFLQEKVNYIYSINHGSHNH